MRSKMMQWESDPLFSAAEVVQDSADRMESTFRLLLHEQSLVQRDHTDTKVLSSIEHYQRDLTTALEIAKWQLEDFEREVNLSALRDDSQKRQNAITRHKQFIEAIREQIIYAEQRLENISVRKSLTNMNLNEQDRNGLALFLSGGKPVEHIASHELEDNTSRFFDPAASSSSIDYISERKAGETANFNMNMFTNLDHDLNLKGDNLRKVGSLHSTEMGFEPSSSIQDAADGSYNENGSWDLEANEAKDKNHFQRSKLRGYCRITSIFGSLGNLLSVYWSRASRSFAKRLKDGEEQMHSPPSPEMQVPIKMVSEHSILGRMATKFSNEMEEESAITSDEEKQLEDRVNKLEAKIDVLQSEFKAGKSEIKKAMSDIMEKFDSMIAKMRRAERSKQVVEEVAGESRVQEKSNHEKSLGRLIEEKRSEVRLISVNWPNQEKKSVAEPERERKEGEVVENPPEPTIFEVTDGFEEHHMRKSKIPTPAIQGSMNQMRMRHGHAVKEGHRRSQSSVSSSREVVGGLEEFDSGLQVEKTRVEKMGKLVGLGSDLELAQRVDEQHEMVKQAQQNFSPNRSKPSPLKGKPLLTQNQANSTLPFQSRYNPSPSPDKISAQSRYNVKDLRIGRFWLSQEHNFFGNCFTSKHEGSDPLSNISGAMMPWLQGR